MDVGTWPHKWLWGSSGKNTGVGSHSLLQGIFPTQGLNPGLPHCRTLYHLNHQERLTKKQNTTKNICISVADTSATPPSFPLSPFSPSLFLPSLSLSLFFLFLQTHMTHSAWGRHPARCCQHNVNSQFLSNSWPVL